MLGFENIWTASVAVLGAYNGRRAKRQRLLGDERYRLCN